MEILRLWFWWDEILRQKSTPIEPTEDVFYYNNVLQDMAKTARVTDKIVWLALPQVGILKRGFVIATKDEKKQTIGWIYINPSYEPIWDEKNVFLEECLSEPWVRVPIERHNRIMAHYTNTKGKNIDIELSWFHARIFQHEYDHLDGILIIDKYREMIYQTSIDEIKETIETTE